jgi:ABC-2 type transport system permease protein
VNPRAGVRLAAEVRHQAILLARDPGPMIGYLVMGLLLITVTRPLYLELGRLTSAPATAGTDQAAAGMAVMFSLFSLKIGAAHLLNERTWHTWDRLRSSPAGFGEIIAGKSVPLLIALLAQQAVLFAVSAAAFGLQPKAGWPVLAACALAWSACVLLLGAGASTLARTPAQLSAAGDVFALLTTVLGGAIVPVALLPGWLRLIAPASPGYWALAAYRCALTGTTAQLGLPLAMLGVFALAGAGVAALISAGQSRRFRPGGAATAARAGLTQRPPGPGPPIMWRESERRGKRKSDSGRHAGERLGRAVRR